MIFERLMFTVVSGLLCVAISGPAAAAQGSISEKATTGTNQATDAAKTVQAAADVVHKLSTNPDTKETLKQAKGVFIVPNYGKAALGIGGAGGEGVLVANNNGTWSAPAFYQTGAISLGLQAGVTGGSIALFVMTDKALDEFRNRNNFSLSADAGLSIINWSARGQVSSADVIAWTDTKGLYGNLAVSVSDIVWDSGANQAYYSKSANAKDIISGKVKAPASANKLKSEFSALESGASSQSDEPSQMNK